MTLELVHAGNLKIETEGNTKFSFSSQRKGFLNSKNKLLFFTSEDFGIEFRCDREFVNECEIVNDRNVSQQLKVFVNFRVLSRLDDLYL